MKWNLMQFNAIECNLMRAMLYNTMQCNAM